MTHTETIASFDLKKHCLPEHHSLRIGTEDIPYFITTGAVGDLHNAKHVAHGMGHGLMFAERPSASRITAKRCADQASKATGNKRTLPGTYLPQDGDIFRPLYGNYVLFDRLIPNGGAPEHTYAILFISIDGEVYQHYASNQLTNPEEVLQVFNALATTDVSTLPGIG